MKLRTPFTVFTKSFRSFISVSSFLERVCLAGNRPPGWSSVLNGDGKSSALPLLNEGSILELGKSGLQLFLGVHDDGTVPGHRLADGPPRCEEKADPLLVRSHGNLVPVSIEDERIVITEAAPLEIEIAGADHLMSIRIPVLVEIAFPFNYVSKGVMSPLQMAVFSLVIMIYIPCISTMAVLVKETGMKITAITVVIEIVLALLVGGLAYRLLGLLMH